MRITLKLLQLVVSVVGLLAFCGSLMLASTYGTTHATAIATPAAQGGMFNPTAHLDTAQIDDLRDTAEQDAAAEGTDVLVLRYDPAPADLWNALRKQHRAWYDSGTAANPRRGEFNVPVGTLVRVKAGLYRATLDGWFICTNDTVKGKCQASSPFYGPLAMDRRPTTPVQHDAQVSGATVLHVAHVTHPANPRARFTPRCVKAAGDILHATQHGKRIEEDLSYRGMTRRAAQCNDALATAFFADGHDFTGRHGKVLRTFLRHVIKTGHAPRAKQMPGWGHKA